MTITRNAGIPVDLMTRMPNYICIRDPKIPSINGTWYDLDLVDTWGEEKRIVAKNIVVTGAEVITYVPIEEFEEREDGAIAQVYVRQTETGENE